MFLTALLRFTQVTFVNYIVKWNFSLCTDYCVLTTLNFYIFLIPRRNLVLSNSPPFSPSSSWKPLVCLVFWTFLIDGIIKCCWLFSFSFSFYQFIALDTHSNSVVFPGILPLLLSRRLFNV